MFPEWVEKYRKKGTTINESNGKYYLYKITSKYDPQKKSPRAVRIYLGKITEEGLIEPLKIAFTPGIDCSMNIIDAFDLETATSKDISELKKIYGVKIGKKYFVNKMTSKQEEIVLKYFDIDNWEITRKNERLK